MNIEAFPGLGLPFSDLLLLMVGLIGLDVVLYRKRQSPWAISFWLPLVLIALFGCSGIAIRFLDVSSLRQGPGDLAGLGFIIDFCVFSPWIVILIGSLFCIPKFSKQGLFAWTIGIGVSAAILGGLLFRGEVSEETNFIVLGPDGTPVPHQVFDLESSYYGNPRPQGSISTGANGTFSLWLTPGKSIFLRTVAGPSSLFGEVRLWNQEELGSHSKAKLESTCDWEEPGRIGGMGSFPFSLVIGQKEPVVLILKSRGSLTSPYVEAQVHALLVRARDAGTCPLDLSKVVANPESLDQLDLIGEVLAKQPSLRPPLLQGLQWSGQFIQHADNATNSFYFYHGNNDKEFRPLLIQWLGLRPDEAVLTFGNVPSVFRQKVNELGSHLIQTIRPYFGTEDTSITVIQEMGPDGHSAIQDFAQAFPSATPRCQQVMLANLWGLRPSVSDLGWLVESRDPHLVFAGYEAAKDTIKPEERALAKERVDEALTKATDPHDMYLGKRLSANLDRSQ